MLSIGAVVLSGCAGENTAPEQSNSAPAPITSALIEGANDERALEFLTSLQAAADNNGGNRATGTAGGEASRVLVEQTLSAAGINVYREAFDLRSYDEANALTGAKGENVFAEIPGSGDGVILLGAHLDSVVFGPGINDNGSGVGALVEAALTLSESDLEHENTIRFAFWDAEEIGVQGSTAYVQSLGEKASERIVAYVNYDMTASKNGVTMIADSDWSSIDTMEPALKEIMQPVADAAVIADGSAGVEKLLVQFYAANSPKDVDYKQDATLLDGTDTRPFNANGTIPYSGIASLDAEPTIDETTSELVFAECYHKACDTVDAVAEPQFLTGIDSALYMIEQLANTSRADLAR